MPIPFCFPPKPQQAGGYGLQLGPLAIYWTEGYHRVWLTSEDMLFGDFTSTAAPRTGSGTATNDPPGYMGSPNEE